MKPFEQKLTDEINRVFDAYQEPVDENAWSTMRGALLQRRRRRRLLWWRAIAAGLLLLIAGTTLWLWPRQSPAPTSNLAAVGELEAASGIDNNPKDTLATIHSGIDPILENHTPDPTAHHGAHPSLPAYSPQAALLLATKAASDSSQLRPGLADQYAGTVHSSTWTSSPAPMALLPTSTPHALLSAPGLILSPPTITVRGEAVDSSDEKQVARWSIDVRAGVYGSAIGSQIPTGQGLQGGGVLHYHLSSRWSLGIGLLADHHRFEDRGEHASTDQLEFSVENLQTQGALQRVETLSTRLRWTALETPLLISWHPGNKGYTLTAGMSSLLFLDQRIWQDQRRTAVTLLTDPNTFESEAFVVSTEIQSYRRMRAGEHIDFLRYIHLSAGIPLQIQGLGLRLEPYLRLPLGPVSSGGVRPAMLGVQVGYPLAQ
jgi:hypothetical protein